MDVSSSSSPLSEIPELSELSVTAEDLRQATLDILREETARRIKVSEMRLPRAKEDLKIQQENLEEIDRQVI